MKNLDNPPFPETAENEAEAEAGIMGNMDPEVRAIGRYLSEVRTELNSGWLSPFEAASQILRVLSRSRL